MAQHRKAPHVAVHHVPGGRSSVVALHGEHDIATAPQVRDALRVATTRRSVVVDLGDCSFLDGSVLGLLIGAQSRVTRRGGVVVIANASGAPLRALTILTSTHRLAVYDGQGAHVNPTVPAAA